MRIGHWAAVLGAGLLAAGPALGQGGGGAGAGTPNRDPNAPHEESGAADLNQPTDADKGTGSATETNASAGETKSERKETKAHKAKSRRLKHGSGKTPSEQPSPGNSSESETKGAPEAGGAQGR